MSAYMELASCTIAGVPVKKIQSTRTGLVVCLAQVEGPTVNGYFCLATEAHDHDGLPHTLEHLIFMGSEKYPYKGVLDLLANRCLAQGTNAWTDVDHTCYTVTTAGSEGFLKLLPIYLDHILYPTLNDAAFLTEVHHINGEGEDAGVVYCEMQARENTAEDRSSFHLMQHMYPGHCGYKSETGGRLENLRESCSNKKVVDYHCSSYRADNLCLIVTGQVEVDQLFQVIMPFEEKIMSKGSISPMVRPWQSPVPPLTNTVTEEVPFPTDEENDGLVRIAWRGPSALDRYGMTAIAALMEYLADTAVAPLQKELVETEDPYCGEVGQHIVENAETCVGFDMSGVPLEKLSNVEEKVVAILTGLADGKEEIDMKRMAVLIERQILAILNQVEEMPHYFFAFSIIGDFLFSQSPEQFSVFLDQVPRFKKLLDEPVSFWVQMIKKYFVDGPHVTVICRPSAELAAKMSLEEEERISKQRESLGAEKLGAKGEELKRAIEQNEIPAPDDIISSLTVPSTESIHFHPLVAIGNHQSEQELTGIAEYKKFPIHNVPFFFQLHHIHSAFVELVAVLDTAALSKEMKMYLPLFLEVLFESPMIREGELISYEDVIKQLVADTIDYGSQLGAAGSRFSPGKYPQALFITIKVEAGKYSRGVQWLREVLNQTQFTKERLSVVAQKMINDVSRLKRSGIHIVNTIQRKLLFKQDTIHNLSNMVSQLTFLNSLLDKLKDPASSDDVISTMVTVRDKLTSPSNLRVFMATNINTLPHPNPIEPWKAFAIQTSSISPSDLPAVLPSNKFLLPSERRGQTVVAGIGGVESNFLLQTIPCVTSHNHPDLPAIMVFIEYLCALEGPMWRQIRGMGLSYNYRIYCKPDEGQLYFQLFKSSQLVDAYKVARTIMDGFVNGSTPFEQVQLESAISGVIYEVIRRERTVAAAAEQALLNYLKQVDSSYSKKLLSDVSQVTIDDLQRVGKLYFSQLLNPQLTNTAICCNPSKVQEVKSGLEGFGHHVEMMDDLNQLSVA